MSEHAIIPGTTVNLRTLADNTVRIQIDIEPRDAKAAMTMLYERGTPVALAVLDADAVMALEQKAASEEHLEHVAHHATPERSAFKNTERPGTLNGIGAQALHASGFFSSPDVWAAVGSDNEFLAWIRGHECVARTGYACQGDVVAAHLRSVAAGSGTGIKPKFCAVPLCNHHHQLQHDKGYSAVHPDGLEGLMKIRHRLVGEWAHEQLKREFGAESLRDVRLDGLLTWAQNLELMQYLPHELTRYAKG